jgi:prepilin-type N-terminal cleavage/methylation domain-containing protein
MSPSIPSPFSLIRPAASRTVWQRLKRGFTLVELLLVVAIISILAAMVISSFSNAAQSSNNVLAQQQLAVWQSALNNWVNSRLGKIDTGIDGSGASISINSLTTFYNNKTRKQRFVLLTGKNLDGTSSGTAWLETMTADHFISTINTSGSGTTAKIISSALQQTNQWLELPAWVSGEYPVVAIFGGARTPPAETSKL